MSERELAEQAEITGRAWRESRYYEDAEKYTHLFWRKDGRFRHLFDAMTLTDVLELSCGHGRHAVIAAPLCEKLTLMDIL